MWKTVYSRQWQFHQQNAKALNADLFKAFYFLSSLYDIYSMDWQKKKLNCKKNVN